MEGLTVLKRLRERSRVPVVVLSVREREEDKIAALDNGADDYVTKPFAPANCWRVCAWPNDTPCPPPKPPCFAIARWRSILSGASSCGRVAK